MSVTPPPPPTPAPPPRVRWASRAMAFGIVVFALGVGVFAGSRFASTPSSPASTAVAIVSVAPTVAPTASPTVTPAPTATPEPTATPTPPPTLERLVGQKLIVRMDGTMPSKALLARAKAGEIGGVVLFRFQVTSAKQLRAVTSALQHAAASGGQPPLLVMIDQEGGGIRGLTRSQPVASASRMGRMQPDAVASLGAAAGVALRDVGVNVDLAPVADTPGKGTSFMRDSFRTFSDDPDVVASRVTAFMRGLASSDVLSTVKHFPGLGRVARNTDRFVETVKASRAALDRDLAPFKAAIDAGVPIVMLSNATYTALDPDNAAGWSRAIATDLLRDELGFTGVSVTDSLSGTAFARGLKTRDLAVAAAGAGVDLVMITGHEDATASAYDLLLRRARDGSLDRATLEASYARIMALKATLSD